MSAAPRDPGTPVAKSVDTHLTTNVPVCGPESTAVEVRALLSSRSWDAVDDIAVCAERPGDQAPQLLGLIPVAQILAAPEQALARDLMDPDPPVVAPGIDQEKAAWKAVRHGESSLAVVTPDGRFRGLVPPTRFLAVLLTEHDEDLARLGGYLSSTASARHSTEEPVRRRLWHRLPWLMVGLAGSAVAAWLVAGFESSLAEDVRLAFFVPGVVYLADAVGTQTETVVIRGLSVGVPIRRIFGKEVLTGLAVGAALGLTTFGAASLVFGPDLALAVSLALVAACSLATVIAMLLPWSISRAGGDPAFGSGPLATVLQDLLSLLIYFVLGAAILG